MTTRTMNANDLFAAAPELMKKWAAISVAAASSLEPALIGLVEIRASQINGCANCINMHTTEARDEGRDRAAHLPAVGLARGAVLYRPRTRRARLDRGADAALRRAAHESAYEALKAQFTEEEQVKLTLMINVINGWNRIAVGFGMLARSGGGTSPRPGGGRLMASATHEDAAASFDPLRPKLMRVAYRMLGSVADAEDVVQEAFIRWMRADRSEVREPEAFLRRTVTRLCLDQLKSARHQRETYIGPWLPDPVVEEERGGRRHLAADAGAGASFSARARGLPAARCVRAGIRGGRRDHPARRRGLPPARGPGAHPCPRGETALPGREATRPRARRGFLHRLAQRRHEGAWRDAGGRCQRPCRRRRQASGSHAADRRLRCRHEVP